jgi:hypothetical protein
MIVSSAIALLSAVVSVRGHFRNDTAYLTFRWYPQPHLLNMRSLYTHWVCGTVEFTIIRNDYDLQHREMLWPDGLKPGFVEEFRRKYPRGFSTYYEAPPNSFTIADVHAFTISTAHTEIKNLASHNEWWTISVPGWMPLIVFSIAPARWLWLSRRRWSRVRRGLCIGCGYNLCSSRDRCPECGRAVEAATETAPAR